MVDKEYKYVDGQFVPTDMEELIIPDEAIYYVVSNFMYGKAAEDGSPVVIGVTSADVEEVLRLFVAWAADNGYIKNGILTMGGYKIDN